MNLLCENNIKVGIKCIGFENLNWVYLAQDMVQ